MIKIEIFNYDAVNSGESIEVSTLSQAEKIVLWYFSFCAGDDITVYVDGQKRKVDENGYANFYSNKSLDNN